MTKKRKPKLGIIEKKDLVDHFKNYQTLRSTKHSLQIYFIFETWITKLYALGPILSAILYFGSQRFHILPNICTDLLCTMDSKSSGCSITTSFKSVITSSRRKSIKIKQILLQFQLNEDPSLVMIIKYHFPKTTTVQVLIWCEHH